MYESDGNVSVCAVLLRGVLGREVAVNVTTIDNVLCHGCLLFPTAGSDYTLLTDYTLSFAAGSPVNSMSCVDIVILVNSSAVEDIKYFYVELSTSDPVNFLSPEHAPVSILDDDSKSLCIDHIKTCIIIVEGKAWCLHVCHLST